MMMKTVLCAATLLVVVTMATAAGRGNSDCGEWTHGECVAKKKACGPGKKSGTRTGENCKVTSRQFRCVVPCTDNQDGPADLAGRTRGRDGRRKNKPVACKYERAPFGDCDPTTLMRTRTLSLKKGDESCEQTKTETKQCKAAAGTTCKYQRGEWGDCDAATNVRSRQLSLKRGDATTCEALKTETRPCKKDKAGNAGRCKYARTSNSSWSECQDGELSLVLQLKKGDPNKCEATKVKTKACHPRSRRAVKSGKCRYQRGEWSACDPTNNTRTRTNTLKRASQNCESTQIESKKCKRIACRYSKGEWGECGADSVQHRMDTLRADNTASGCEATRSVDRRCRGNRQGRCTFGNWSEFGECVNGVKTKKREVTHGGSECQRRAVRTKPCRA